MILILKDTFAWRRWSQCLVVLLLSCWGAYTAKGQEVDVLEKLVRMPLKSIGIEYPNKTGQVINSIEDAHKTPSELHPVFYGSFDWHSSVHSHWMLVRTLRFYPDISLRDSIVTALDKSLVADKLLVEAQYFDRPGGASFERTYGWAWLLKLDEELVRLSETKGQVSKLAQKWHANMKPLTETIVKRWQAYLPKMTYADRIGTHSNTAFGLSFAIDWADRTGAKDFAVALRKKAIDLYANDQGLPSEWEPNATDFFSPSLIEADLMQRVLKTEEYRVWLAQALTSKGWKNLFTLPVVSDLNDYHIVHLVGLSFSRAWCMATIAQTLDPTDPFKSQLEVSARRHYESGMLQIFHSNYGGDHWLGSFAAYAYDRLNTK